MPGSRSHACKTVPNSSIHSPLFIFLFSSYHEVALGTPERSPLLPVAVLNSHAKVGRLLLYHSSKQSLQLRQGFIEGLLGVGTAVRAEMQQ